MRLAIFAIVLTGADALSLRGHPSLLQAKLPLPQNSTAKEQEKTLGDMEATLMRMAKSGHVGTPLKDFADLIMPHLTSMEGAINASHTTDQTTMDSYGAAFTTCTEAKTTADGEASTLLVTKGTQSTAHKNCRTSEGMAQTNYTNCVTAMNSLETSKKTACDAYILANKAPDVNLVPQPGMGASYRSWLVSVKDWVINELANLDAAHESCVNASILYDNKKLECEGTNGQGGLWLVHDNLKAQCNANQTALEGTTCSYAAKVESSCSEYSTCYSDANDAYESGKSNLLSAQSNRVTEYNLVKRLMCFCNLFSQADGADLASADIDACKNASHDTTHLQLTLPIIPGPPVPCQAVDQKPCTPSYNSTEYGSLPSNAQAATCQACPSATTTTTTVCGNGWEDFKTNYHCYKGAGLGGAPKSISGATALECQNLCAGHPYMALWTSGTTKGECKCFDYCSSGEDTYESKPNTVCKNQAQAPCPLGWTKIQGKCYKAFPSARACGSHHNGCPSAIWTFCATQHSDARLVSASEHATYIGAGGTYDQEYALTSTCNPPRASGNCAGAQVFLKRNHQSTNYGWIGSHCCHTSRILVCTFEAL